MALVNCPECGRQVSQQAIACPHCGHPIGGAPPPPEPPEDDTRAAGWWWIIPVLVVVGIAAAVIGFLVFSGDDEGDPVALATTTTQAATTVAPTTQPPATTTTPTTTSAPTTTTVPAPTTTQPPTTTTTTAPPTTTTQPPTTTTTTPSLPSFVTADCIGYDPGSLEIEDLGATGWRLNAGSSALLLYDNQTDAERGLAIAGNHTELCFIGRDNTQADRFRYIHEFWNGDSGAVVPIPGPEDCLPYDPTNLAIADIGGGVWRLTDGASAMASYDGEPDALAGQTLAEAFSEQCFIGRDNTRTDRIRYIREYWK